MLATPTSRTPFRGWRCLFLILTVLLPASAGRAWGPHPAITQAALDALGTNHPLPQFLGEHAQRLTNHCWMADFKRLPFRDRDQDFYADDYLLFLGMSTHLDHICPEVKKSYAPYFKRALQAMRTESPANAARWIGSLLHFTEDTGSPPHAAEIRGGPHVKMENWVDAAKIRLDGYQPQKLGGDEATALEGFLRRMDGLIAFSKGRGNRLTTHVLIGNRRAVEPVVLECALETSRVAADLLHTLGELAAGFEGRGAGWTGQVQSVAPPGYERVPARVVLRGTPFATEADATGRFLFHRLPPHRYEGVIFRPGSEPTNVVVVIAEGATVKQDVVLPAGNLLRNGDFSLRQVRSDGPDCWSQTAQGWEGEVIALEVGHRYRLKAYFHGGNGEVLVRWSRRVAYDLPQNVTLPRISSQPLRPGNPEMTIQASESMALLQVTVRGTRPEEICRRVELLEMK